MIVEIAEEWRYVHVERGFIVIHEKEKEIGRVPIDTLTAVIISAQGATLSKSLLSRLAGANIPVVICGANYLPISMTIPITAHYKQLEIVQAQTTVTESLKKEIWQNIVRAKLCNQAAVLRCHSPDADRAYERILLFSRKVRPGDPDNYEANAARIYWLALFGKKFIRDTEEEGINAMLNYVYAILRACMARAICAAGLLPLFGVHHHNKLNPFCLADDLMEPLRPLGDDLVATFAASGAACDMMPQNKRILCAITEATMFVNGKQTHFIPMTFMVAQSLAASYSAGKNLLCLPEFTVPEKSVSQQIQLYSK